MLKTPFVIYADFESILLPISTVYPNQKQSFTVKTQKHEPICYALFVIIDDKKIIYHKYYRGNDCVDNFLLSLQNIEKFVYTYVTRNLPMTEVNIPKSAECYICKKPFKATDEIARDHSHLEAVSNFRGYCHSTPCNLNLKESHFTHVVLHGLSGYDSHMVFKRISNKFAKIIKVIPINNEKFTTFTIDNLKFIDSYNFLSSSLSKLVESLNVSKYDFPILNEFFQDKYKCIYLRRKGVFPYTWFDNIEKLNETKLPEKNYFYNDLTKEQITNDDYKFAQKVWKLFQCKTLEDYLKLYLFTDCLLLADVFESFRDIAMKIYNLEVLEFISAADLSWSSGLKVTSTTLELLTDIDMYLTIERGIRGGLCLAAKRFSKANNKYLPKTYDPNLESKYIINLDILNLYGFCMTSYLPHSNYKWVDTNHLKNIDILNIPPNSETGYIFVVTLTYPDHLHDEHNLFPLAPDHVEINYSDLSPHQQSLLEKFNIKYRKTKKLIPNLKTKKNYVVYYLNLQYYLKKGLILKKIHKAISFKQTPWLKSYIELNSNERKNATGDFYKSFFKLMNNSFYGRTLLNTRKLRNVAIAVSEKECKKHLESAATDYFRPINENCVLFKKKRSSLYLNNVLPVGFVVLELAKLHCYRIYYDVFKKIYGDALTLLYCDTDSFVFECICDDIYVDFQKSFLIFLISLHTKNLIFYSVKRIK